MKKNTMLMALAVVAGTLCVGTAGAFSQIYDVETNNAEGGIGSVVESFQRNSNQLNNSVASETAMQTRLRLYWADKNRTRESMNTHNQKIQNILGQKSINVNGESTLINRSGELQDRSGIQQQALQRVEAVNAKAVFIKRAKDYYIDGGYAATDLETMSKGNVDGMNNRVNRAWYFSPEYMMERGFINYVAKDPLRDLNTWTMELGAGQQEMYNYKEQNSGFSKVGITPFSPLN